MKDIPDRFVDMILCDLPYGMTAPKCDENIDIDELWKAYNRIIKNDGAVLLFASQPFTTKLISSNEKEFKYCWHWIKNLCVFKNRRYHPQITTGHIPTNSDKGCSNGRAYHGENKRDYEGGKTTRYPTNILEFKCVDNYSRVHSSQKPVELLEYLIRTYTNKGDTVLDNCMGSGSTGIACVNTGRKFIGFELDEKYFNIAKERITEAETNKMSDCS